jgi:succinoglycan biosynthesis transport protein ExoP
MRDLVDSAIVKAKRNGELIKRQDSPLRAFSDDRKDPHVRDYWRVLVKHRWTVLTCFLVTVITVSTATFVQQPVYKATATLKIDKAEPKVLKFEEVASPVESQGDDYYQTQYKLLTSYSLAERVVKSLKLDSNPEFSTTDKKDPPSRVWAWIASLTTTTSTPNQPSPQQSSGDSLTMESPVVKSFLKKLDIEPVKNSRLVKVSFLSASPELSAQTANAIAEGFIEHSIEQRLGATKYADAFLTKQIQEVRAKLERSDELLHKFAKEKQYLVLDEKQEQTTKQLSLLTDALMRVRSERLAKEALYRQTQGQDFQSIPAVLESLLIGELKKEYFRLQAEYGKLSETFLPDYPRMMALKRNIDEVKAKLDGEVTRIVKGLQSGYEAALKSDQLLQASVDKQKQLTLKTNEDSIQYNILKREVDINRELYAGLLQRMKEIAVSAGLGSTNIQVVDPAKVPLWPDRPKKMLNVVLSLVVGLTMGIGLAFVFEYFDNTLNTVEEIEYAFGTPIMGLIPGLAYVERKKRLKAVIDGNGKSSFELSMQHDPSSLISEAIRTIRTSILFSLPETPPKLLLVTSPEPGDGKTGLSVNLAVALSQLGREVLLIDADMRYPDCHRILGQDRAPGLSNFLVGDADLTATIKPTKVPKLYLMPAGQYPLNPAELLGSERMKASLDLLGQQFSHVIIDSPPVLGFTDSVLLSTITDGVLLVIRAGKTSRDAAERTIRTLDGIHAKLLGVVFNNVNIAGHGYSYYSHYLDYYRRKSEQQSSIVSRPDSRGRGTGQGGR